MDPREYQTVLVAYNRWRRTELRVISRAELSRLLVATDFIDDIETSLSRLLTDGYLREVSGVFELTEKGKYAAQRGPTPDPTVAKPEG